MSTQHSNEPELPVTLRATGMCLETPDHSVAGLTYPAGEHADALARRMAAAYNVCNHLRIEDLTQLVEQGWHIEITEELEDFLRSEPA